METHFSFERDTAFLNTETSISFEITSNEPLKLIHRLIQGGNEASLESNASTGIPGWSDLNNRHG
jgi:hypothetical protein